MIRQSLTHRKREAPPPPHQIAYQKEVAAAATAKDDALAASLKAERNADRLARSKRLSGLAHRPAKTTYVLRRIGLTPEEWSRLEYVGSRLVTGLKPSQKPSKSVIVAAMLARLC